MYPFITPHTRCSSQAKAHQASGAPVFSLLFASHLRAGAMSSTAGRPFSIRVDLPKSTKPDPAL